MTESIWAILPAAGVGSRMQADRPKQYLPLKGRFLLDHTLDCILSYPRIGKAVVVLSESDPYWPESEHAHHPDILRAVGGNERCHSVLNGLHALEGVADEQDWVAVHDIARPCLQHSDLDLLFAGLGNSGAILASPTRDTMKRGVCQADGSVSIEHTVEREQLWHALTPQVFRYRELREALEKALNDGFEVTDEASAIEHAGGKPRLIAGRADNIKVTRPEDLALAELFLNQN
ncbi:2-C-methyl-D-erythritol 4-phosphate cytidylyltransferase [Thalassolituus maritimus]|uniref:2-C-methyl-D-erythritol 4-phosphate cytidylyltransferase n=1 Tax=Thalassolituus maritimus TaxID=484498 RepID=A0ABP9ZWN0_9GAMM